MLSSRPFSFFLTPIITSSLFLDSFYHFFIYDDVLPDCRLITDRLFERMVLAVKAAEEAGKVMRYMSIYSLKCYTSIYQLLFAKLCEYILFKKNMLLLFLALKYPCKLQKVFATEHTNMPVTVYTRHVIKH